MSGKGPDHCGPVLIFSQTLGETGFHHHGFSSPGMGMWIQLLNEKQKSDGVREGKIKPGGDTWDHSRSLASLCFPS